MKFWFHAALALLTFAGVLNNVGVENPVSANPLLFDFEQGFTSPRECDAVYEENLCEGISQHFTENQIPVGAIDLATGKEIIGYEVHCPGGQPVVSSGTQQGSGQVRVVPRSFGYIRVKYAP